MPKLNIQDIKDYRRAHDCSLLEAKRAIVKRTVLGKIERARAYGSVDDLCDAMKLFVEENSKH